VSPPRAKRSSARKAHPRALEIKATIRYITPPIWRRIEVSDQFTLEQLHRVLQLAFAWLDYHLHAFHVAKRTIMTKAHDDWNGDVTSAVRLSDLKLEVGGSLLYTYDFGDSWEIDLAVQGVSDRAEPIEPRVLAGERAGPPEDCGGPPGYEELVEAFAHPSPDNAEQREWAGDFDPECFDLRAIDSAVRLAAGWRAI
jgi:hypothetical protein